MSQPLQKHVIQGAIDIISDHERWCAGMLCKDRNGVPVSITDTQAQKFCAMGAIMKVGMDLGMDLASACRVADEANLLWWIAKTNDLQGREAVINQLRLALTDNQ